MGRRIGRPEQIAKTYSGLSPKTRVMNLVTIVSLSTMTAFAFDYTSRTMTKDFDNNFAA